MNKNKKAIEKLTSRVKIYLVIIALLFILICTYDLIWIIPSILLYGLLLMYTIWFNLSLIHILHLQRQGI